MKIQSRSITLHLNAPPQDQNVRVILYETEVRVGATGQVAMEHPILSRGLPFANVVLTIIQPLGKLSHVETIDPTLMDLIYMDSYIPVLFAYRLANKSDTVYSHTVERIKLSLQNVLTPFFSFAGRWISVSGGSRRKLVCNDEGVPFIEAYLDRDLDSVVDASTSFQAIPELQGYGVLGLDVAQSKQQVPDGGLPSIFVQITRFKCGGLVLAVTFNHMQTDAKGFFNFMKAWSDVSRTNETKVKVDHNRAQVDIPSLKALLFKQVAKSLAAAGPPAKQPGPRAVMKSFEVGESTIKHLKEVQAEDNQDGRGIVSTDDCIVAHLWKSLGGLPSSLLGGKEVAVSRIVEGRSRFYDPPLPDLCGNAFTVLLPPKTSTDELLTMPLTSVASRLRETLQSKKREDWLNLEMCGKLFETFGSNRLALMWTTSWLKFPIYEMDFGFGKPYFAVATNSYYSSQGLGKAYIFPPIPNGSSSVATLHIWSTPEVLQSLESNPHFLSFFLVR